MRFRIKALLVTLACLARAGTLQDAEKELFAARYKQAAVLYSKVLETDPSEPAAYYGLVRSLLKDHRSREAYQVAAEALGKNPQAPGVLTAAGLAAYRGGDVAKAEEYFRSALRLDGGYAGALQGLAAINRLVSNFKTARDLVLAAYHSSPNDPQLIIARAGTLKGAEHIAALREALAILDPESEEGRELKAHIANDVAAGNRERMRLASPYQKATIKLFTILDGPRNPRGVGIRVRINQRQNLQLLLDTGASGISVSPKAAERAGLEMLGDVSTDAKGIGDESAQPTYRYVASEVRIGEVAFADFPISVFRSAKSQDFDGLIGADVFDAFIMTIDFPKLELSLDPRPAGPWTPNDEPVNAGPPFAGFHRVYRLGDHLAVPTRINDGKPTIFLIDSGSSSNLIDTEIGGQSAGVYKDDRAAVRGIEGKVSQTSRADHVTLLFAGFRQESPSLYAISLEKLSDTMGIAFGGILGWPVLSQLSVTIDYREGTVHFEHKK